MNDQKRPWQSKTLWVSALTSIAALFVPGVTEWVAANPTLVMLGLSGLFALLRILTKGAISVSDNS